MLSLEEAMDAEEAARSEAEQSWFSWQDDAGAEAEEKISVTTNNGNSEEAVKASFLYMYY